MKAFLIDPFAREITEVEHDASGIDGIYELIDAPIFATATFNEFGDTIFVDDEGLFREDQAFFRHDGYPQPLAGKGLVLGCDDEGETVAPSTTLEALRNDVSFVQLFQYGAS